MRIFLLIIVILTIQSCDSNRDNNFTKNNRKKEIIQKKFITSYDTLTLGAEFDEKGEFGGHLEQMHLFYMGDNLYLKFSKTNIPEGNDYTKPNFNRKVIEEKTYLLNKKDESKILNYLKKLLEKSLNYKVLSNAGKGYYANMDNLHLYYHHNKNNNWSEYAKLIAYIHKKSESTIPTYVDKDLHGKLYSIHLDKKNPVKYNMDRDYFQMIGQIPFVNLDTSGLKNYLKFEINDRLNLGKKTNNGFLVYKNESLFIGNGELIDSTKKYGIIIISGELYYMTGNSADIRINKILIEEEDFMSKNSNLFIRSYKNNILLGFPKEFGTYIVRIKNNKLNIKKD
ncbi:MAG: hypothetical protein R6U15_04680 [Candidatus Izemoplasmatales bacterium]